MSQQPQCHSCGKCKRMFGVPASLPPGQHEVTCPSCQALNCVIVDAPVQQQQAPLAQVFQIGDPQPPVYSSQEAPPPYNAPSYSAPQIQEVKKHVSYPDTSSFFAERAISQEFQTQPTTFQCTNCPHINPATAAVCELCGFPNTQFGLVAEAKQEQHWTCSCSYDANPMSATSCGMCGKASPFGQVAEAKQEQHWTCSCSYDANPMSATSCGMCGKASPYNSICNPGRWVCSCGYDNPSSNSACELCGKANSNNMGKSVVSSHVWVCSGCTYQNTVTSQKCICCGVSIYQNLPMAQATVYARPV